MLSGHPKIRAPETDTRLWVDRCFTKSDSLRSAGDADGVVIVVAGFQFETS